MTVDIKKVLAMPPIEQFEWLLSERIADDSLVRSQITNKIVPHWIKFELGHLAFRYRDKAVKEDAFEWTKACESVFLIASTEPQWSNYDVWWQDYSQPIHWILSSLLAKEASKNEKML